MSEEVLVVPSKLVWFTGSNYDLMRFACLLNSFGQFMSREEAEADERYKQVIPYIVAKCNRLYMSYVRGSLSGEDRLKAKRSVGIGGHVNPVAGIDKKDYLSAFISGMQRELDEEVQIETAHHEQAVSLINEDTSPVGRVHIGVVFLMKVIDPQVYTNEPDKVTDVKWTPLSWLQHPKRNLEYWSRLALQSLRLR